MLTGKREKSMRGGITPRQVEIIRAVVSEYILTGEPVGSKALVEKFDLKCSSATVRKEMSLLEQLGFLRSPHTSAGRVPTDLAIRLYAEELIQLYHITLTEKAKLEEFYAKAQLQMDKLLSATAQMLAATSKAVGVVLAPTSINSIIRRLELVSIADSFVLAVLVAESGNVYEKKIKLDRMITQERLYKVSRFLTENLRGYELHEIQNRGLEFLAEEENPLGEDMEVALQVAQALVYNPPHEQVYVEGETEFFRQIMQNLKDEQLAERFIEKIRNREFLIELLQEMKKREGIHLQLGIEIDGEKLEGVSIMSKAYSLGGKPMGAMGVIGPSRMAYDKLIPTLDYSSQLLSDILNQNFVPPEQGSGLPIKPEQKE
ncbi:MAG: heat-inducible transcription repressor HrcA [Candidatus Hydrogenedentota bacterium]|nr:MAG: heat-inducible transcription repressor HrcA [Candidatus Hydrogenedentota bacterium]